MKKLISLLLILFLLPTYSVSAFINEGIYDMAYSFAESGYARVVTGEKWGIIDTSGEFIVKAEYDFIGEAKDGLIKAKKGGLFGFLDESFNTVIEPSYANAEDFSEGFAAVANESGKWGYIDKSGKALCDFLYDEAYSFSENLARIATDGKYGYIDKNGDIKITPAYSESYDFSCGLACVNIDGKFGFIDKDGNLKIEAKYDAAWDFSENLAAVKTGELWSFIDTEGNVKISGNYDCATRFKGGLAPVRTLGRKYGLIDTDGKLVIAHKYDYISEFSENFAFVRIDEKYGYINSSGITVIPIFYSRAGDFNGGYAPVGMGEKVGYIDKSGNLVAALSYLDGGKFSNGLANVRFENGLWGYTDFSETDSLVDVNESGEDAESSFSPDIIANTANVIKLKIGEAEITVNGKISSLSAPPVITDGRTLLPIRAVVEAAGGTVDWDSASKKVTISYDGGNIVLQIGSNVAKVNGVLMPLDVAPEITDGSTMVPLRFVAERLGMGIKWDGDISEVTLYY